MAQELWRRKRKLVLALLFADEDIEAKRNRTVWTRSWIKRRNERGAFHQVIQEMLTEDELAFQSYFRMNKEKFFELVRSLQPTISKQDTVLRESIKADERVAVTLRYLATGETFSSLETQPVSDPQDNHFRNSARGLRQSFCSACSRVFEGSEYDF